MELYFSDYFEADPSDLEKYGAFDISVVTDLPLFIDPLLLFNSDKPKYRALHEEIIEYLVFLRDEAKSDLNPGLIKAWYTFKEVRQNWLGFTQFGNGGSGLVKTLPSRSTAPSAASCPTSVKKMSPRAPTLKS
jgi:hypothetical protein